MALEVREFNVDIRSATDYLAYQQALPSTATVDGNGAGNIVGQVQGALEVVVRVYETLAMTGTLTIKLQSSTTEGGSYADVTGASFAIVNPSQAPGVELGRFAIDRLENPWMKVVITTTAAATGKINVYPAFVGR